MARTLTAPAISKYRAGKRRREVGDGGCPGLRLLIGTSGAKSFVYRYRRPGSGRPAKLTLGPLDVTGKESKGDPVIGAHLTLVSARLLAAEVRRQLALGRDPGVDHQVEKQQRRVAAQSADAATYPAMARLYVEQYAKPNRRDWRDVAMLLGIDPDGEGMPVMPDSVADRWRSRAASSISKVEVVAELDRAAREGRGRTRANHVLEVLRGAYRWHMRRGSLESSPCALLDMPVPVKTLKRSRRLSDDEVRWMWRALGDMPPLYAAMVRLMTLTGVRRDEAREMTDAEVSGDEWVVPGGRTKNKLDHFVPLSREAKAQISAAQAAREPGRAGLVFTLDGERVIGGLSKWKRKLDARMLALAREERGDEFVIEQWQLHDLRRVVRSYLSKVTSSDIAERCIGHAITGVRAHYDLHEYADQKRRALALWAKEVGRVVTGATGKVVVIRKRRGA
jgi:integrase